MLTSRLKLLERRDVLESRLARMRANVTRPLDWGSKERAKKLGDSDVVDAPGIGAIEEPVLIRLVLGCTDAGKYGICYRCGNAIGADRLQAWPYASQCIDCACDNEILERRA
jgi:hypothetical protein